MKIQSKYGLRVVSKANGDLLEQDQYGPGNPHGLPPEKAGAYVQGGSWFFCDSGNYLLAGIKHFNTPDLVSWRHPAASRRLLAESCRRPE